MKDTPALDRAAPAAVAASVHPNRPPLYIIQSFSVLALSRTSAAHSSLIIGMMPVWALLLSVWRGLGITPRKVGGMLAAMVGVVVLLPVAFWRGVILAGLTERAR